MSDAYIGLIYLASAKNFLYDKNGMQRQQTVTRISLNISQGQKEIYFEIDVTVPSEFQVRQLGFYLWWYQIVFEWSR